MTRNKSFGSINRATRGKPFKAQPVRLDVNKLKFALHQLIEDNEVNRSPDEDKILANEKNYKIFEGQELILDIVNMAELDCLIKNSVRCGQCQKRKCVRLNVTNRNGLAMFGNLSCQECGFVKKFANTTTRKYEIDGKGVGNLAVINLAFVCATRLAGIGKTAAKRICTFMNLADPPSKWTLHQEILKWAFRSRCQLSMKQAILEAREHAFATFGWTDLTVSFDGSWMRRGHLSLVGITSAIALWINKIVGIDVRHLYCPVCKGKVRPCPRGSSCGINYVGSSGGMESLGAVTIIKSIYEENNTRITRYLGDGDSRAFAKAKAAIEFEIEKLECSNHLCKRVGSRLRKRKKETKALVLSNGRKGLGGRGGLTDAAVDKIQSFYNFIIHNVASDAAEMRRQILAMFDHISSTDLEPKHEGCDATICKYLLAIASEEYFHTDHFHIAPIVMEEVRDIFEDLSSEELLAKVTHGKTQNANESLNSTVWNLLSKRGFANRGLVELGVSMAVVMCNEGQSAVLDVLQSLGIPIGAKMSRRCQEMDKIRVEQKKRKESSERKGRKGRKRRSEDWNIAEDDYAPGLGDLDLPGTESALAQVSPALDNRGSNSTRAEGENSSRGPRTVKKPKRFREGDE